MNTIIYYFSGTGNSFKIAEELSRKLNNSKIIAVANARKEDITDTTDSIGIVFPILMFGIPVYIKTFIKDFYPVFNTRYLFFIASNGGNVAGSFLQIRKIVHAQMSNKSFHSFTINRKCFCKDDFNKRIAEISAIVQAKEQKEIVKVTFKDKIVLTGFINKLGNMFMKSKFTVSNKCIGCGTCYKMCPVNNIKMVNGKPEWGPNCNVCYGCINWCPENAVSAKNASSFVYKSPLVESANELFIR
jgi:ferredoxin